MQHDTFFKASQETLVLVARAIDGFSPVIKPNGVNSRGVLINPRLKLATLKAARDHIEEAIEIIERKWPAT